jgi:Tfp pilus assembly protein PilO
MTAISQHDPSKRLQRLSLGMHALGLSIVLATAGLGYVLAIRPLEDQIADLDDRSVQLEGFLRDASKVRGEHQRLLAEMTAAQAGAADLQKRVPDEPFEAEFLGQLTEAASQSGLRIGDYHPGVVHAGQRCSQLQVQLSCQGTYRSICEFLDRLATLPRITQVEKLDVTAAGPDGHPVTLWLVVYFRLAGPEKIARDDRSVVPQEMVDGRWHVVDGASYIPPTTYHLPNEQIEDPPLRDGGPVHG